MPKLYRKVKRAAQKKLSRKVPRSVKRVIREGIANKRKKMGIKIVKPAKKRRNIMQEIESEVQFGRRVKRKIKAQEAWLKKK